MRSAATCHSRERRQDARIVSRTWPGSMGSAVRNRSLAWATRLSSVTSGRKRAPHDSPGLQLLRSSCHRFHIRSRQAKDLARRLATDTDSLNRMRGTASAVTTAMAIARPAGVHSCGSPG
jgi:hypothetical protein